jgi:hypothetical protein
MIKTEGSDLATIVDASLSLVQPSTFTNPTSHTIEWLKVASTRLQLGVLIMAAQGHQRDFQGILKLTRQIDTCFMNAASTEIGVENFKKLVFDANRFLAPVHYHLLNDEACLKQSINNTGSYIVGTQECVVTFATKEVIALKGVRYDDMPDNYARVILQMVFEN